MEDRFMSEQPLSTTDGETRPRTLFDKIWQAHVIERMEDGRSLLYVDRHLLHEVTSPQAFEGLRQTGRRAWRPEGALAVPDHNVPTDATRANIADPDSRAQVEALARNSHEFGVPHLPLGDIRQGIVHVIGPEQGLSLPGTIIVCGDSHTSTHGAFGAFAFGIGTSDVEHVLATQSIVLGPARNMLVEVDGELPFGTDAKDLALTIIRTLGTAGGTGHVIEYAGSAISALDMAGRMTLCNMSIEAGARAGLIAPDEKTYAWLAETPQAPKGDKLARAIEYWKSLRTDSGALFDRHVRIDASEVVPMVSWGTTPDRSLPVTANLPSPGDVVDDGERRTIRHMLDYMGLEAGQPMTDIAIDTVFIGSCTNGRIEDIRSVAAIARGRHVAAGVRALVVPGSGLVRAQAEREGLDQILVEAGFEWREPGCSMCIGMNGDQLSPGERCASTSNRNFEGRQGPGGRTHLMSPAMAAAAAIRGHVADAREFAAEPV
jgi:3-isopropylmalate/(R)-2-methylmalate dehydratase large subunit